MNLYILAKVLELEVCELNERDVCKRRCCVLTTKECMRFIKNDKLNELNAKYEVIEDESERTGGAAVAV